MKRIILIYGLIIGTVFCANIGFMVYWMYYNSEIKGNDVLGYAVMVLVFSLIFFGIRNYRNRYMGGFILHSGKPLKQVP
jgi:hypothetical protein